MRLLLHACCGPCSLEPLRLLLAEGHDIALAFHNPNIAPAAEHDRRLSTLRAFAEAEGVPVYAVERSEGEVEAWEREAGSFGAAAETREDRCGACYRLRLDRTARLAVEEGFDAISTTLSVSPYQYTELIDRELAAAAERHGLVAIFRDFRPWFPEAERRSRELEMYRQNYCGCRFSVVEAREDRERRREERRLKREAERAAHAEADAEREAALAEKRAERAAYADKQRAKREALKRFKQQAKAEAARASQADRT